MEKNYLVHNIIYYAQGNFFHRDDCIYCGDGFVTFPCQSLLIIAPPVGKGALSVAFVRPSVRPNVRPSVRRVHSN